MTNKHKKIIIFILIILIVLVLLLIILKNKDHSKEISETEIQKVSNEAERKEKNAILEKLYKMNEQDRINYYCAEFFKLIDKILY